jgi:isoleucyl-tRNA synthetase
MPLVLPYQNAENAFRVILGDFVTTEDGTELYILRQLLVPMMKVAKEATPEIPPMLVLDENGTRSVSRFAGKILLRTWRYSGKYVKNEYYKVKHQSVL